MKGILSKLPPFVTHIIMLVFGIILLIDTLGFFKAELDKTIIVIAICMIVYSFIGLGGIDACKAIFSSNSNEKQSDIKNKNDHNDSDFI